MTLKTKTISRAKRVRKHIAAVSNRPRLSVFRSSAHIWAQIIDDKTGSTIVSFNDLKLTGTKTVKAEQVGQEIAKLAILKNVKQVVYDRGSFRYHGRVKALAEAARANGLEF